MQKYIILSAVCLLLAGCGVKPSEVDPPLAEGEKEYKDTYPHIYPNPATDPAPSETEGMH